MLITRHDFFEKGWPNHMSYSRSKCTMDSHNGTMFLSSFVFHSCLNHSWWGLSDCLGFLSRLLNINFESVIDSFFCEYYQIFVEPKSSNYASNTCFNILRVIYLIHTITMKILSVNLIFCNLLLLCSLISSTNSHPTGMSAITNDDKLHLLMSLKII